MWRRLSMLSVVCCIVHAWFWQVDGVWPCEQEHQSGQDPWLRASSPANAGRAFRLNWIRAKYLEAIQCRPKSLIRAVWLVFWFSDCQAPLYPHRTLWRYTNVVLLYYIQIISDGPTWPFLLWICIAGCLCTCLFLLRNTLFALSSSYFFQYPISLIIVVIIIIIIITIRAYGRSWPALNR